MIKHFCDQWIEQWCKENGWTDLVRERNNNYWAFPPGAVIPEPIPVKTLRIIKAENGLSPDEKFCLSMAFLITLISFIFTFFCHSPMPIVFAFALDAIASATLEIEL